MRAPPPSTALTSIRTLQWNATGRAFLRVRPLVVAPGMALTLALLAASRAPRAQCVAVAAGFTLVLSFFLYERASLRNQQLNAPRFFVSLVVTLVGIAFGCAATGGARSPLLALVFAPTVTAFTAFGPTRRSAAFFLACACVCALLLALPYGVPFPPPDTRVHGFMSVGAVLTALALLLVSVTGLTEALRVSGETVAQLHHEDLERAHAHARMLEEVTGTVAHEIKNPLAAIKGLVQLVAESPASPRTPARLEVLQSEVARMEALVHDALSVSRPVRASSRTTALVEPLLHDVASATEPHALSRGVRLSITPTSLRARIDPRAMRDALVNLVRNAIDASPHDSVVTLTAEALSRGLLLRVHDRGHGMTSAVLANVGAPFFTTRDSGHGLGVLVARSVVERHGGTLRFESAPGEGTLATLALPNSLDEQEA